MSEENAWKDVVELHKSYRVIGLSLIATIIGLCASINLANDKSTLTVSWFIAPLILGVLQQLGEYLANMYMARAVTEGVMGNASKRNILWQCSNWLFQVSEALCFSAVTMFIVSILALTKLLPIQRMTEIGLGLCVIGFLGLTAVIVIQIFRIHQPFLLLTGFLLRKWFQICDTWNKLFKRNR